jgi:DNA polymerase/3'-5' exonuclease PolX
METLRQELIEEGFLEEDSIFSSGQLMGNVHERELTTGNRKIIALTKAPSKRDGPWRQVDIRLCPRASVPYMLVGNTGDMQLMKMLRGRAMEKGLTLNEYGMGKPMKTADVSDAISSGGVALMVRASVSYCVRSVHI